MRRRKVIPKVPPLSGRKVETPAPKSKTFDLCPRCFPGGGGLVLRVLLRSLDMEVYLCDACDALWLRQEDIRSDTFVDFATFMEERGKKADVKSRKAG